MALTDMPNIVPDYPPDTFDNVTHATAIGAIVSPLWLHHLSDTAAVALPILGCGWLLLQAFLAIYRTFKKDTHG